MEQVRKAAFAGSFYPDNPSELRRTVRQYISSNQVEDIVPLALVAPHAGYIYSGSIAGCAYAFLQNGRDRIKRVILFGPSHRVSFSGMALSSADAYESPLGRVPLDKTAAQNLLILPFVKVLDQAHVPEHSLEVQLPFLQEALGDFTLLPIVVGDASPSEVCQAMELLMQEAESFKTVLLVSSDLSHYLEYEQARSIDRATSQAIEKLSPDSFPSGGACGSRPLKGLLEYARRHDLKARTACLANSGDTAGDRSSVVGYGAFIFA